VLKDIEPLAETAAEVAAGLIKGEVEPGGTAAVRVEVVTPDNVKALIVDSGFLTASELPACAGKLAAR
jgi:hypothetical protein